MFWSDSKKYLIPGRNSEVKSIIFYPLLNILLISERLAVSFVCYGQRFRQLHMEDKPSGTFQVHPGFVVPIIHPQPRI